MAPPTKEKERMLLNLELGSHDSVPPTPKIRYDGALVPPCTKGTCSVCSRQFLSLSARALLRSQHDYQLIEEKDAIGYVQELGQGIEKEWHQLRLHASRASELLQSFPSKQAKALIEAAFPKALPEGKYLDIQHSKYHRVKLAEVDHGLKIPEVWAAMGRTEAGVGIVADLLESRGQGDMHPGLFVALDSMQLQLGWVTLLFRFSTCPQYLDLSIPLYANGNFLSPTLPSALHSCQMFSYERGILVLQRQKILYTGLARLALGVCNGDTSSVPASLPDVYVPASADRYFLESLHGALCEHLTRYQNLFDTELKESVDYINGSKSSKTGIGMVMQWLSAAGCRREEQFSCAATTFIHDRINRNLCTKHLLDRLKHLRSAVKGCLQRNESKIKLIECAEQTEEALLTLLAHLGLCLIKHHKHYHTALPMLKAHDNDFLVIARCESNHLLRGGSASIWRFYELLELRVPVLEHLEEAIWEAENAENLIPKEQVLPIVLWLELCADIVRALELICPCSGVVPESTIAPLLIKHAHYSDLSQYCDLEAIEKDSKAADSGNPESLLLLWKAAFQSFEARWDLRNVSGEDRATFRRHLGMVPPKKRKRRRSGSAADSDSDIEHEGEEVDAEDEACDSDSSDVIQLLHGKAPTKPRGAHFERHDPLAHLFEVNETLMKYGVSENVHWATASTPRPSQFEDEDQEARAHHSTGKPVKRRNIITITNEDAPELNPGILTAAAAEVTLPQVLVFTDVELYDIWRGVFPSPKEPPARTKIRWSELRRTLTSPPLNFTEERIAGVECKFKREAMDGYDPGMIPLHQPHGCVAWLEKELLWVTRGPFRHTFGWEAECFALED